MGIMQNKTDNNKWIDLVIMPMSAISIVRSMS